MSSPGVLRKDLIVLFGFSRTAAMRHYLWFTLWVPVPEDPVGMTSRKCPSCHSAAQVEELSTQ